MGLRPNLYTHNSWFKKGCHPNYDYVTTLGNYKINIQTSDALRINKILLGTIDIMLQNLTDLIWHKSIILTDNVPLSHLNIQCDRSLHSPKDFQYKLYTTDKHILPGGGGGTTRTCRELIGYTDYDKGMNQLHAYHNEIRCSLLCHNCFQALLPRIVF